MSKIEVNTIEPQCGTTVTVGKCTSTVAVPGNVVKSNALQASDGGVIISQSGTDITLGASGDTVALASGATQTGFGRTGTVDWQTGSIKTATFAGTNGEGYFANTTAGVFDLTLPASPTAGDIIAVKDYAGTFDTNALTIDRNGKLIDGQSANLDLSVEGQSVTLVYVDGTKGWLITNDSEVTNLPKYVSATGGNTSITCGDYKTHIFTGPGALCVSCGGNSGGSNAVDYIVVAGGGSTNHDRSAGAGAGGFRIYSSAPGSNSPLVAPAAQPVTATSYAITVGGGAVAGGPGTPSTRGSDSIFHTKTSTGGGAGNYEPLAPGGSGGGWGCSGAGGSGNTGCLSPPQGNDAGASGAYNTGTGGGGGAGAVGGTGGGPVGADGGAGSYIADPFIGPTAPSYGTPGPVCSTRYFAGGGGGAKYPGGTAGAGGVGGGGAGGPGSSVGTAGTINTGGGAGGSGANGGAAPIGAAGGSGIVIIRYKFQ